MMNSIRMAAGLVGVVLAVANTLSVQGGNPDPSALMQEKAEKASKFEGRWIVVSSTVDGDAQDVQGDKFYIAKGQIRVEENGGEVQEGTYEVDTTKTPYHIDVTPKHGKDKGKVFKGILILEENLLKICLARPGDDRPTEASSREGSGHILLVAEPAKSER
jgi:uncharacterized protein (TIGR03067 family)